MKEKDVEVMTLPAEERIARQMHRNWVVAKVAEGWVLGPEGDRSSPLLRPWTDLPEKERAAIRGRVADNLSILGKRGFRVEAGEEHSISDADKESEEMKARGILVRENVNDAKEFLDAIAAADVTLRSDGLTEGVRRMEKYYDLAKGKETNVAFFADMAINYGLRQGMSFDDVNTFVDIVNAREGTALEYRSPEKEAAREKAVVGAAFAVAFKLEKDTPRRVLEVPEMLSRSGYQAKESQVELDSFLRQEKYLTFAAYLDAASRTSEIAHDEIRSRVISDIESGGAAMRHDAERTHLGYDLGVKAAFDNLVVIEERHADYMRQKRLYDSLPAIRKVLTAKPSGEVPAAEREAARQNLERVLAERISLLPGSALRRIDFPEDGSSVKVGVGVSTVNEGRPVVTTNLLIYDGTTGYHQGYAIEKDGTMRQTRAGYPESEITVELPYTDTARRPEFFEAQYKFAMVSDMVRCAALEPVRLTNEPNYESGLHDGDFRKDVNVTANIIAGLRREQDDELSFLMRPREDDSPEITDELITAYIENRATPEERKIVDEALLRDPQLRETLDVIEKVTELKHKEGTEKESYQADYVIDEEEEEDLPEIYTNLPGEITPRDYDMLIAYGFSQKDIKKLGIEKHAPVNTDIYIREKQPWDSSNPGTRSVYINLSLTPENKIMVSDPISGKELGEAWKVLSSGKNLNFLQIHKDAEMSQSREKKNAVPFVKLK